jgi:hypothetical protein
MEYVFTIRMLSSYWRCLRRASAPQAADPAWIKNDTQAEQRHVLPILSGLRFSSGCSLADHPGLLNWKF